MTDAELLKRLQKVRDWLEVSGYQDPADEMNLLIVCICDLMINKKEKTDEII